MAGRPLGSQNKDKPFRTALMLELKAAGEDMPALREIAQGLIERAKDSDTAMRELVDRLDGKAIQTIETTIDDKRDAPDWTRDELVTFLNDARTRGNGAAKANGSDRKPDSVH